MGLRDSYWPARRGAAMIGLACATLSCDGFGDNDFVRSFEMLPEAGFKYVEFNCWHPGTLTPSKMRDLRARCERTGLTPCAVYSSGFGGGDPFALTKDVAHKIRMMEAARELGCRRIVATGPARDQNGGLDAVGATLELVAPTAEELDVLVCLENHANNALETIDDYASVLERIPSRQVGVCLDAGHFDASDVDMDELIDRFAERINHIHLKENDGRGAVRFTRFGEGTTDLQHVVERMIEAGYEGFLTVELAPHEGREATLEDIMTPLRMFRRYERD
jgi:sugar phosphate isomerase/epimerase